MNFARFLSPDSIKLSLQTELPSETDEGEISKKSKVAFKKAVVKEMAETLYASGKVQNLNKLSTELMDRESKTSSAIGMGIAIPHARCLQTKNFIMGFIRCENGVEFMAPDEEPVQIFIPMVAPPYNDKQYLKIYRTISKAFLDEDLKEQLLEVETEGEVIRIFNRIFH